MLELLDILDTQVFFGVRSGTVLDRRFLGVTIHASSEIQHQGASEAVQDGIVTSSQTLGNATSHPRMRSPTSCCCGMVSIHTTWLPPQSPGSHQRWWTPSICSWRLPCHGCHTSEPLWWHDPPTLPFATPQCVAGPSQPHKISRTRTHP